MMRQKQNDDSGAVLLLVLLFVTIFAVILGALLPQIAGALTNSTVVRDFDSRAYVADSGLDYAIQRLRWDSTLCPDAASGAQTLTTPTIDPRVVSSSSSPVTVTCQTQFGSVNGLGGYAVITTGSSTTNSISASLGGDKLIGGPVWTNGLDPSPSKLTIAGDVEMSSSSEPCKSKGPGPLPSGNYDGTNALTISSPSTITCFAPGTSAPVPSVTAPDKTQLSAVANSGGSASPSLDLGDCKVYAPGVYTAPPANANNVYLQSGVYWFDNVNWIIDGSNVVGGLPGPGEQSQLTSVQGCSSDIEGDNGRGVTIVLAGASSITLNKGALELFTRWGGAGWEGTQGISVETVTGWSGSAALSIGTGSKVQAVAHGLVFAPDAPVLLGATAAPVANILGGVVAKSVTLNHSASVSNGTLIDVHNSPGYRRILLTSTVPGESGGRDVVATAVVDISNDSAQTFTIESRRNGGYSSTS